MQSEVHFFHFKLNDTDVADADEAGPLCRGRVGNSQLSLCHRASIGFTECAQEACFLSMLHRELILGSKIRGGEPVTNF